MFAIPSIVNIVFAGKEFLIQAIGYILYPNKIPGRAKVVREPLGLGRDMRSIILTTCRMPQTIRLIFRILTGITIIRKASSIISKSVKKSRKLHYAKKTLLRPRRCPSGSVTLSNR